MHLFQKRGSWEFILLFVILWKNRTTNAFVIFVKIRHSSLQPDLAPLRQDENRDLPVLDAEADGGSEGVLGKEAGAVEVVEAVGGVEPAAHVTIVPKRVAHHPAELFAGMAALRGGVCHDNALRGLRHRGDIHRESVGMLEAVRPNAVRDGFDTAARQLAAAVAGGQEQSARQEHRHCYLFREHNSVHWLLFVY